MTYHLRESGKLWSSVLTTTITGERLLIVCFPLKVASMLTRKVTLIIILVETVVAFALGSYTSVIFTLIFNRSYCLTDLALYSTYNLLSAIISKGFGEIACSIMVLICTTVIIVKLVLARAWRQSTGDGNKKPNSSKDTSITIMLVVVAIAFVVLRAPYTICYYLLHYIHKVFAPENLASARQAVTIGMKFTYTFVVMNYALNFFLYR